MERIWINVCAILATVITFAVYATAERCHVATFDISNNITGTEEVWCENGSQGMIYGIVALSSIVVVAAFLWVRIKRGYNFTGLHRQNMMVRDRLEFLGHPAPPSAPEAPKEERDSPPPYWACVPATAPPSGDATRAQIFSVDGQLPPSCPPAYELPYGGTATYDSNRGPSNMK
ncbi:hypothetical protein BaRGS_00028819 [Batillaria attramentaria]|uniref:Uncharacterized protein n=1 Tax=Batillaria attramentaria TaxID=370345 RepID=A0ABD0JZ48_9CAEN